MPDGDDIHPGLAPRYLKPYKQLCEGTHNPEEVAHSVLKPLKKTIQDLGNSPNEFIAKAADQLAGIPNEPLLRAMVDWGEESQKLDKLAQLSACPKRAKDLILQACKQLLQDLRYGEAPSDLKTDIIRRFYRNLYDAEFDGRMQRPNHYNNADQAFVDASREAMSPYVAHGIDVFAEQMVRKKDVSSLRCPVRTRPVIDEDPRIFSL